MSKPLTNPSSHLLTSPPGRPKFGQDLCHLCIHSFSHQLQFPSFPPRRHSPGMVLLPGDRVRYQIRVSTISDPLIFAATTSQPRANSNASTLSQNRPSSHGSPSPCRASPPSEPTTKESSSLDKMRAGSTETKCVISPISRSTDGSQSVWNASVLSLFYLLRPCPSPPW